MKVPIAQAAVLLVLSSLLCGCWDTVDIEEFDIALVAGYDTLPTGDQGGIAVTSLEAAGEDNDEWVGTYSAKTVGESRALRAYNEPRQYTLTQLQAIVIGHDLALQGVESVINTHMREPRVKPSINVAVVDGRAEELLQEISKKDPKQASSGFISLLQTIPQRAFVPRTSLYQFIHDTFALGTAAVTPLLQVADNQLGVEVAGSAIFAKGRMLAHLDRTETRALVLLSGRKTEGWIPYIIYKDGELQDKGSVFVANQRKVKVSRSGDVITFDIKVILRGRLVEHSLIDHTSAVYNEDHLREIEQAVARDLRLEMMDLIDLMQEQLKLDVINITPYALAKWRREITPQLEQGFIEDVVINVEVDVIIQNTGELG